MLSSIFKKETPKEAAMKAKKETKREVRVRFDIYLYMCVCVCARAFITNANKMVLLH